MVTGILTSIMFDELRNLSFFFSIVSFSTSLLDLLCWYNYYFISYVVKVLEKKDTEKKERTENLNERMKKYSEEMHNLLKKLNLHK